MNPVQAAYETPNPGYRASRVRVLARAAGIGRAAAGIVFVDGPDRKKYFAPPYNSRK